MFDEGKMVGFKERLQNEFRAFLRKNYPDSSKNTINGYSTDAFYMYNNGMEESFWRILLSEESTEQMKLLIANQLRYKGISEEKIKIRTNTYIRLLKMLKEFFDSYYSEIKMDLVKSKNSLRMERFSEKSLLALGDFYVYGLIDPRTDKVFYIGKGTGNRVFEHEKESLSNPDSDKLKLKTISEIVSEGLEVKKIIINSNLTENEAFAAEASLINIFNYISDIELTNIVAGHHSSEVLTVEEFERINGAEELAKEDIKHKVVFIKINKLYKRNITADELYDAIRGVWVADLKRIQNAEYVLGVYKSLIVAAFKPTQWYKCKEAVDKLPKHINILDSNLEDRVFFVDEGFECGEPNDENQIFYCWKSIEGLEKIQRSQNPVNYENC